MNTICFTDLWQLPDIAKQFLEKTSPTKHYAFYGDMGAGKTTFIKELCKQLQTNDVVTSPTFSIINEYQTANGNPIYHFDFYRIKNLEEVFNIGYEDYFYSAHYCFIEWPELVEELLPDTILRVKIKVLPNGAREISY